MKELSIEQKLKDIEVVKQMIANGHISQDVAEKYFPEIKESEDELTWLTNYISEEAKCLSMDIRDDDDRVTLKNLQRSLAWLEKQDASKSNWKPTEEQYEALTYTYNICSDTERGNYYEGVLETLIEDLHRLDEQHPKFKIGDTIKKKSTGDIVTISVVDLKNREYRLSNTGFIPFKYEHLWELIEQNSTDKAEPEFHEGDWVVSSNGVYWHIDAIQDGCYQISASGTVAIVDWPLDTKNYHKFTIQDAKDGDVLVDCNKDNEVILMFRGIGNTEWDDVIDYHCYYSCLQKAFYVQKDVEHWGDTNDNTLKPATKEQRELFFSKMKEAGYKWDSEQKQLITLDHFEDNNDMVEPKFKVDDIIHCKLDNRTFVIKEVDLKKGVYIYTEKGCGNDINYADEMFELVEPNPYSGTSFVYNNHTWGMCARDGGVDILCDSKLIKHIGEQKPDERKEYDFVLVPFGTDIKLEKNTIIIPYGYVATIDGNKIYIKKESKGALEAIKEEKVDNANKVESKFKVGDIVQYITDSTDRRKIEEVDTLCNMYHTDSSPIMFEIEDEWKVVVNAEDVEQNPTDELIEAEPRFKVGEWIIQENIGLYKVAEICESWYEVIDVENNHYSIGFDKEYMCHLWSIQDAKDGDVIYAESRDNTLDFICIFSKLENEKSWVYCNVASDCDYLGNDLKQWDFDDCNGFINLYSYDFYPTSKEQRDILFQKMKEAGYEWDAENKKLTSL